MIDPALALHDRGFPADFPVVGYLPPKCQCAGRRGFPADFPVVGCYGMGTLNQTGRGFPADFPVVGSLLGRVP